MLDPLDPLAPLVLALLRDPAAMRRAVGPDRRRLPRLRAPVVRVCRRRRSEPSRTVRDRSAGLSRIVRDGSGRGLWCAPPDQPWHVPGLFGMVPHATA